MTAFITLVLYNTGRSQSPLLNLYLLVIIACAMTLGRVMTPLEVLLLGACYPMLGYADYGIDIISPETFTTLMASFSPFLLVAYVTSLLAEDIHKAKFRITALSRTDELTGLLNVRAFSALFDRDIAAAQRYRAPFTLMMIDVDRLKQVNDRFGHAAGTQLLRMVAAAIGGCVRSSDVLARLWRRRVRNPDAAHASRGRTHPPCHSRRRLHYDRSFHRAVGQHIGIAAFPESGDAAADVLEKADIALYQSK